MIPFHPSGFNTRSGAVRPIACLLLCAIAVCGCSGNGAPPASAPSPVAVAAQTVRKTPIDRVISTSGNIEGMSTVKLGFMVGGKVNFIAGNEGAVLEKGRLVASLDPENYRIAKAMADAGLDQARDEFKRAGIMYERKSVSEGDFTRAGNALKHAEAQQRLQAKNLSDTRLYSPITGVLLKKGAEVGEIVGAGMPLFVIADIRTVKVNAAIPETDVNLLKLGAAADVYIPSLDSTVKGRVAEIGSLAEPATRSFAAKIEIKNPKLLVRPGMTAEISIPTGRSAEVVAVPGECVLREPDNSAFVFVVDGERKQAFKRKVSLGRMHGNSVEVSSGLNPGDLLVVAGQHKLTDGSPVTLK
jgi:RND family efflux transporter MFP subunit